MGNNITLRQLEYFVAVAEHGSIAAAAEVVHVSAVAVGAALTELERSFSVPLLVRERSKGVQLTDEGQVVLVQARDILRRVTTLPALAGVHAQRPTTLRLGIFGASSALVLPAVARYFAELTPPVPVEFKDGSLDELAEMMNQGELDVVVGFLNQLAPGLKALPIMHVTPGLIVPPDHPLAQRSRIRLADLADEKLVLLRLEPAYTIIKRLLDSRGVGHTVGAAYRSVENIKSAVAAGQAVGLLYSIGPDLRNAEGQPLSVIAIEDLELDNALSIMIPDFMEPAPVLDNLAEAVRTITLGSPHTRLVDPSEYQWVRRPLE